MVTAWKLGSYEILPRVWRYRYWMIPESFSEFFYILIGVVVWVSYLQACFPCRYPRHFSKCLLCVLMSIWYHRITKQLRLERTSGGLLLKTGSAMRPDQASQVDFYIQSYIPLTLLPPPLISVFTQQKAFIKTGRWVGKERLSIWSSAKCKFISRLGIPPIVNL